jgi:hypothetical protein
VTATPGTGAPALPDALARLLRPRAAPPPGERCDMCAEPVADGHPHVVDTRDRRMLCACRACALLFTDGAAAGGRYRTVPDRWLRDPDLALTRDDWDRLQIPVRVAFFFVNSALGRAVCFYPGPGGATESELPMAAWDALLASTRLARSLAPDVEALLVDRGSDAGTDDADEPSCHLVPIDVCYELIGRLRMRWVGFDGGAEAREEYARFRAMVRDRSRPLAGAG